MTNIEYVMYDVSHTADFVYDIPEGLESWLIILTKTPAEFWVDEVIKEYPANCAAIYPPNHKIFYRACRDKYVNDWIRFTSKEEYLLESSLPLGIPFPIQDTEYLHKLFQLLATENFLKNDYKDLSIDYLLKILFNKLYEASNSTERSPHYQNLINLRMKIQNNPGKHWSVTAMADSLNLSAGYLQSLYKSTFGISCMADVINSRISLAKDHLAHSSYSISKISILCGYTNIEHFCRQFQKKTGSSPGEFRQFVHHKSS
ncbi:MAG: helix-turn-helix transcriptional regulator [Halanaerobiaceae bacterium]